MDSSVGPTLRDRKRARTRAAIVAAGTELFARHGYDETTVADIAVAADIGTRTFFSYFTSKEELLFPENDARLQTALDAIDARGSADRPADLLLRALGDPRLESGEIVSPLAALRLRLMETVPAVRGRALQMQRDAQRQIATRLIEAFPELDEVNAAALTGAFIGAVTGALDALLADPAAVARGRADLARRLREATSSALAAGGPSVT
ncbi:TetR/AcrR family transcriptional regulator [Leifsonia poae]|uniref:TetR/AcrR family transcriptional regulator n=1 Tax=Leifsonia poae TaxID=110933 RepID=UPI001CBB3D20|nr:TetR/AcrR family transcriptional regulator [Leifsonia poae]